MKKRVLFLCTHNSARSQIAEAYLRHFAGERVDAESAGTQALGVHPLAVRAMAEVGIDISGQRSKTLDDVRGPFDVVVTVCDALCPIPPGAELKLRWKFPDPTLGSGSEERRLARFRRVRDGIRRRVEALAERL